MSDDNFINYQAKTFRLSEDAIQGIYDIQERLSNDARINFSQAKVLELIIFHCLNKTLTELTAK